MAEKKKRNLYKSLGLSTVSEEVFNAAIAEAGRRVRKECIPKVIEADDGTYIVSGPVSYWISKDKRRAVVKAQGEPDTDKFFPLFVKKQVHTTIYKTWCHNLFLKVLQEKMGSDARLTGNSVDFGKCGHIGTMLSKLCMQRGKTLKDHYRVLYHLIWQQLDPEALSIAIKTCGYGVGTYEYCSIIANIEEARKIFKTTPGVIPVWLEANAYSLSKPTVDENETDRWINNIHSNDDEKKTVKISQSIVQDTQQALERWGCNAKRIWKLICKMKPRWSRSLISQTQSDTRRVVINLLAEVGELPRYTVLRDFAKDAYLFHNNYNGRELSQETKVAFLRAAFRASLKKPAKKFWSNEASLVWDWILRSPYELDHNQRSASWGWFMRMQEDWHQEQAARRREEQARWQAGWKDADTRLYKWESLLSEFVSGQYKVTPLITSSELREEGVEMHHCVSSYDWNCEQGDSRIFSIKKNDSRVATLEIRRVKQDITVEGSPDSYKWILAQVRGPANQDVDNEVKAIANETIRQYNKAQKINEKEIAQKAAADTQKAAEGDKPVEIPNRPEDALAIAV